MLIFLFAEKRPCVGMRKHAKLLAVFATLLSISGLLYALERVTSDMDAIRIMVKHGSNCFRLRLFVNPPHTDVVVNDLSYTIALAKRIKAAGARLLLDLHYSDTWADPAHQLKPEAWSDLDFDALVERVYEYTRMCIATMKQEGVLPDMVQPGNEITWGMLWPDGKLYGVGEPEEQWWKFARLLKAAIRGIKDAAGDAVQIVLHVHCGGDWRQTQWFFENVEKLGVQYDIIGLSYYPWWHGTVDDLRDNLRRTAERFSKDIFVVETAYPYRHLDVREMEGANQANMRWPMTPEGQRSFLVELIHVVQETPGGHGLGVLWWYPEAIPVEGLVVWNDGATALFDRDGKALPAMDAFLEVAGAKKFLVGGDVSALAKIEAMGGVFRDDGDP